MTKATNATVTVSPTVHTPKHAKAPRPYVVLGGVPNGRGGKELWIAPETAEALAAVAAQLPVAAERARRECEAAAKADIAAPAPAAPAANAVAAPAGVDPTALQAMLADALQRMLTGGQLPTAPAPAATPAADPPQQRPKVSAKQPAAPTVSPVVSAAIERARSAAGVRK